MSMSAAKKLPDVDSENNKDENRRRAERRYTSNSEPVFVELRHTFGDPRTTTHRVCEHDAFGLSFLSNTSQGYLLPGTPVEYALTVGGTILKEDIGFARYYCQSVDDDGKPCYRIGLENSPSVLSAPMEGRTIRPPRLIFDNKTTVPRSIVFVLGGTTYDYEIIDISRFSAAFFCDNQDILSFRVSTVINDVLIYVGDKTAFQGSVTIIKVASVGTRERVVVEPRGAIFDIENIEHLFESRSVREQSRKITEKILSRERIGSGFKASVADFSVFLDEYRDLVNAPHYRELKSGEELHNALDELLPEFSKTVADFATDVNTKLSEDEPKEELLPEYKSYYQKSLGKFWLKSPFCKRCYEKPLGYPGDYEMMRMIRGFAYDGPSPFDCLVNKTVLGTPSGVANRNRIHYLAEQIAQHARSSNSEKPFRVLSVACGPALETEVLLNQYTDVSSSLDITLLDQEYKALCFAQENIYKNRILNNSRIAIRLLQRNIGAFVREITKAAQRTTDYDLVYVFGLFDYFDAKSSKYIINKLSTITAQSGTIIVSNYSLDNNPDKVFMEFGLEWYMFYRDSQEMMGLVADLGQFKNARVESEPTGIIKFLHLDL